MNKISRFLIPLIIFLCHDTVKTASYIAKREGEADTTSILVRDDVIFSLRFPVLCVFRLSTTLPRFVFHTTPRLLASDDFRETKNRQDSNPGRLGVVRTSFSRPRRPPSLFIFFTFLFKTFHGIRYSQFESLKKFESPL